MLSKYKISEKHACSQIMHLSASKIINHVADGIFGAHAAEHDGVWTLLHPNL